MQEDSNAPLEIYISFTSLPAIQVADMLQSLHNLYRLVSDQGQDDRHHRVFPYRSRGRSELCLDFVRTGESITFRFGGRNAFPKIEWKGSDVDVELPVWTAAALGVGALLLGGDDLYDRYQTHLLKDAQIQTERKQSDKLEAEIEKMRAETNEILARAKAHLPRQGIFPRSRTGAVINQINEFHTTISNENIEVVSINGIFLKGEDKRSEHAGENEP